MSVVTDRVRRLDAQLDRIPLVALQSASSTYDAFSSPRVKELLRIVKALSTATSSSTVVLSASHIRLLLSQSGLASADTPLAALAGAGNANVNANVKDPYVAEIEWLVVGKAAIQVYGVVLSTLLDQIVPLNEDIWYWDIVLSSYTNSSIYTIQACPLQLWEATRDVYRVSRERMRGFERSPSALVGSTGSGLVRRWRRFYAVVNNSIRERSVLNLQNKMLSPIAKSRARARQNQAGLERLRQRTAHVLGMLMNEGFTFSPDEVTGAQNNWKAVVLRSVGLMEVLLKDARNLDGALSDLQEKALAGINHGTGPSMLKEMRPALLAQRLLSIIGTEVPAHIAETRHSVAGHGKPSRLVRYWLPVSVALLSSSTIFRIILNRRADIITWIADFGSTARDFWFNWVVGPVRKIIGTIRHDESSEIAIMSRDSLRADRESLERMVVDFAIDKPQFASNGSALSDAQIADIRSKVAEGDVTPVLRAFEKELKNPLSGAVRGDLLRSLLIQVQKTKVDIEVAISGIDSLLKSQELVFGFLGLTPGILVSWSAFRYLTGAFAPSARNAQRANRQSGKTVRILRSIDRILTKASQDQHAGMLGYHDVGLLVCEVHVLRGLVREGRLMPRNVERELLQDLDDLASAKSIEFRSKTLERIRWAYARWLR